MRRIINSLICIFLISILVLFLPQILTVKASGPPIVVQYHVWMDTPYGPESIFYPRSIREFRDGILWGTWDARRAGGQPTSYGSPDIIKSDGFHRQAATSGIGYPMIGLYDPDNTEILRWHIKLAKSAGIGAFAVSAYSWDTYRGSVLVNEEGLRLAEIFRKMLDVASEEDFYLSWELYYGGNISNLSSYNDIVSHPNYFRINNKPLIWIAPGPLGSPNYWGNSTSEFDQISTAFESALGTPIQWAITRNSAIYPENSSKNPIILTPRNIEDFSGWPNFIIGMRSSYPGRLIGAHVYPGFDDSISIVNTPRFFSRSNGSTLLNSLNSALSLGVNFIFLESWNDFTEATAIEPGTKEGWNSGMFAGDYYKDLRIISQFTQSSFETPQLPNVNHLDPLYPAYVASLTCNPAYLNLSPNQIGSSLITASTRHLGTSGSAQVCVSVDNTQAVEMATLQGDNSIHSTNANWISGGHKYIFTLRYRTTSGPQCSGTVLATCSVSTILRAGDLDIDGDVDINDHSILVSDFGDSGTSADFNNNGTVDIFDYNILVTNFGR